MAWSNRQSGFRKVGLTAILTWLALATFGCSPDPCADIDCPDDRAVSPASVQVREPTGPLYLFLEQGDVATADQILDGVWELPRFGPYRQDEPSWTVDPFQEKYWRFIYYSLRHTRHLLAAYMETGDERYAIELRDILTSYVADGVGRPPLQNKHTAAFASIMVSLVTARLAQWGFLDQGGVEQAYGAVEHLNDFLLKPENFEPEYNHGITQAAALLYTGSLFDSEEAPSWQSIGRARLAIVIEQNVDDDGAQVEQSPFYHFYVLKFLWQILDWSRSAGVELNAEIEEKITSMVGFGQWFILPDGSLPLLGATQFTDIRASGDAELYEQIEASFPQFEWFRSGGAAGESPTRRSQLFETAGFSVMRSIEDPADGLEWLYDDSGGHGHLVFDVGPYRTLHSDLDALSIFFFAAGAPIFVDSGLFSLEEGPYQAYFRSTRAHNTVVVNGQDQSKGTATPRLRADGEFWSYQSGDHSLFDHARHVRGVFLIGANTLVVVDRVTSRIDYSWEQVWNLPPSAREVELDDGAFGFELDGAEVKGWLSGVESTEQVSGSTSPIDGFFSESYEIEEEASTVYLRPAGPEEIVVSVFRTSTTDDRPIRDVFAATTDSSAIVDIVPESGEAVSIEITDFGEAEEAVSVRRGD